MQIKTEMRYYFIFTRLANIKNSDYTKSGKNEERRKLLIDLLVGMEIVSLFRRQIGIIL